MTEDLTLIAAEIREKIQERLERMKRNLALTLADAIEVGGLLTEAKEQVPHGSWLPWLSENFGFTRQTAAAYMRLSDNRAQIANATSIREALRVLADVSRPELEAAPNVSALHSPAPANAPRSGHQNESGRFQAVSSLRGSGVLSTSEQGRGELRAEREQKESPERSPSEAASDAGRAVTAADVREAIRTLPGSRARSRSVPRPTEEEQVRRYRDLLEGNPDWAWERMSAHLSEFLAVVRSIPPIPPEGREEVRTAVSDLRAIADELERRLEEEPE